MSTSWQTNSYALTGGLGSGKTTAAQMFKELGAVTISADELARRVVEPGTPGIKKIVEEFGADVLRADGSLNRTVLAERVFGSESERKKLEAITHPLIQELAQKEYQRLKGDAAPLVIYDVPLYFEAGLSRFGFKGVIVVTAPTNITLTRVQQRGGFDPAQAKARMSAQIPLAEKVKQADFVLNNEGTLAALKGQVVDLFAKIRR